MCLDCILSHSELVRTDAGATMARLNRLPSLAVLLAAICFSPGLKASAAPIEIPVMTQNLYVWADATPVLANPTPATIKAAFNSVLANNFPARAAAIASEAASAGGPLLIGLQEASIISAPGSATLDYAQILINALAARGLNYRKPASTRDSRSPRPASALPTRRWYSPDRHCRFYRDGGRTHLCQQRDARWHPAAAWLCPGQRKSRWCAV
jgi:hypothetical protein